MAASLNVAEEGKTATWVGRPGIFLGKTKKTKESIGGAQTGARTKGKTDQREGHTAICKNQTLPKLVRRTTVGWLAGRDEF